MRLNDIQHRFVLGDLDDPLRNVSVAIGDRKVAALGGRLRVTQDGAPCLEIYFQGDPLGQSVGLKPGTMIPDSRYATITAETHSGFELRANRLFYRNIKGLNFTRFEFFPHEVELCQVGFPVPNAGLEGILTSFPESVLNSDYSVEDSCPMFGERLHAAWFRLDFDNVELGLRKSDDGLPLLKVWSKVPGDPGVEHLGQAFIYALSFLTGRRLSWRTRRLSTNENVVVRLKKSPKQTVPFYPPLPQTMERKMMEHHADLLFKGTVFFGKPESKTVLTALQVGWDSADNFFVTRDLLLCIALEGLADYVLDESPQASAVSQEKEAFKTAKHSVIQLLAGHGLKSSAPGQFEGDSNLIRIVKGIEAFSWLRAADKIEKAGQLLGGSFTDDDLKAWKRLRNQPAHGDFDYDDEEPDALQNSHWDASRVAAMLNKLVLGLIGYRGPIRDYSIPGFPFVPFPKGG
jgi:hypothetical protein